MTDELLGHLALAYDNEWPARLRMAGRVRRAHGNRRRLMRSVNLYLREARILCRRRRGAHDRWKTLLLNAEMTALVMAKLKEKR